MGDPEGTIAKAYGVRWPVLGLARRATFLIGSDETIRFSFNNELDPDAHVTSIRDALARQG